MKIDKVAGGHVPHTTLNQKATSPAETASAQKVSESYVNANTAAIEKAQNELAKMPDVDLAKVQQVRLALARGEIGLDSKALSQAVMQFHTGHE